MSIILFGGAGAEGRTIGNILAKETDVEKIVVFDRSEKRANRAIQEIGAKAEARIGDVDDHDGMVKLMKESDMVINMVGPFYRHGTKVLSAAIEAKKNYVDICDDYDAVRSLLALDGEAKNAGVTALITMGSSPGVCNVLAKYGADKLDQTNEINISWCVHYFAGEGGAGAGLHGYHMMSGNVPQYLDGKWVDVPAGSGEELIEFPGCGTTKCYYVGHSEPITLPHYIKGVKTVTNKGNILPEWIGDYERKLAQLGLTMEREMRIRAGLTVIPVEVLLRVEFEHHKDKDKGRIWGGFRVDVKGVKNSREASYIYFLPPEISCGAMSLSTALPCAVGALMVMRGEFKDQGVSSPEALDPKKFLSLLAKRGMDCYEIERVPRRIEI